MPSSLDIQICINTYKLTRLMLSSLFTTALCAFLLPANATEQHELQIEVGKQLYFDRNLSKNRTQSCATCHAPEHGFVDARGSKLKGAVSLGDDGLSFGDRSAPTASYANQIPDFHLRQDGQYVGGQFWDGRETDLKGQAGGPPLNPIEMGMPDISSIISRLQENPFYINSFKTLYGDDIFNKPENAYQALTISIATFEQTDFFSPFDSKYDLYLKGKYELTEKEDLGMTLFFSEQFTNCNQCHQLSKRQTSPKEVFSDYTYHNIGVPVNTAVREHNKTPNKYVDQGLFNHPEVDNPDTIGKFKVPTLRNIAVTAPYMHNGVFKELKTVIDFYNKYNSKNKKRQISPETNLPWAEPEIEQNISLKELESGPALDDKRISALVAFLKILTDQRYEHMIQP